MNNFTLNIFSLIYIIKEIVLHPLDFLILISIL